MQVLRQTVVRHYSPCCKALPAKQLRCGMYRQQPSLRADRASHGVHGD